MALPATSEKCVMVNLATAERMQCQFNPAALQERIGNVQYARKEPLGASYQVMHYRNTNNRQIIVDFYLDAIGTGFDIDRFREFLLGLTRARSTPGHCPPALLFVWPRRLTVVARLVDVAFLDEQFATTGAVLVSTAQCTLEVDEQALRAQKSGAT
jgi:hypothetical protein